MNRTNSYDTRAIPVAPLARLGLALTAAVLVFGVGPHRAISTPKPIAGHFGPGEFHEFVLKAGPLPAGHARLVVGSDTLQGGQTTWPIVFQVRSSDVLDRVYPLDDRLVTHYVPRTRATQGFEFYANEGGKRSSLQARMDPSKGIARVQQRREGEKPKRREIEMGRAYHDAASAIYWLRLQPLKDGDENSLRIFTGYRPLWAHFKVLGRETRDLNGVPTPMVKVALDAAFKGRFEPKDDLMVWFTDDDAHVLTRMELAFDMGTLSAELENYAPGARR